MPALVFTQGPNAGRRYKLGKGDYVIGRRSDCQIFVPDMRVSRQHARVRLDAKGWCLEDLGSNNGTYLNGNRVTDYALLDHQDEIKIAHNVIVVDLPEEATHLREPAFDANVTVVDFANPRIIRGRDEQTQASGLWQLSSAVAGAGDLERQQRLVERKLKALSTILDISGRTAEPTELLDALCEQLLGLFPEAASVGVLTKEGGDDDYQVLVQHVAKKRDGSLQVPRTLLYHLREGENGILLGVDAAAPDPAVPPRGSRMGAPVRLLDDRFAVLYVECADQEFHQEDVDLLTSVANQASMAIQSARVRQEYARQKRFDRDLKVARQIQRSLLPPKPPGVQGLSFAVHYEPAYTIGGDFYDFIWHDRQRLALVAGDVSGKAISAALYMARLTSELRSRASICPTPATLLRRVNQEMMHLGDDGMFATLVYAVYDLATKSLVFSNAGHQVPLLRRDGKVYALEADTAHVAPVGVLDDMEIGEARVQLQDGDTLLLTTDGIHEARGRDGSEYGGQRLMQCIEEAKGGPDDIVTAILDDIERHVGSREQSDDMTILAMSIGRGRARRLSVDNLGPTLGE